MASSNNTAPLDDILPILRMIDSRATLAAFLGVPYTSVLRFSRMSDIDNRYWQFNIKKKSGEPRKIQSPYSVLKDIQQRLKLVLEQIYWPKPATHGFVSKRSIVSNSKKHVGKKAVLNLDLKDFFPNINFGRVRGMLMAKPYLLNPDLATIIAQLCCHENQLPQGAPTSPILSNMICIKLDAELQQFASKYRCTYSRYADDITFSTTAKRFHENVTPQSQGIPSLGEELRDIISSNGFEINYQKVRLQTLHDSQEVTGLTVNKFPNVSRNFIRQIRAMLHAAEKFGLTEAAREFVEKYDHKHRAPYKNKGIVFSQVILGKLAFLKQVKGSNDPVYQALMRRYNVLVGRPVSEVFSTREMAEKATWVLECDNQEVQGTGFFLKDVGLVTCDHVVTNTMHAFQAHAPNLKYPIKIIARQNVLDIAILHIDAPIEYAFEQTSKLQIEPEENVTVVGHPTYQLGDSVYINKGVITSTRMVSGIRRLNTSASIVGGNSGGPVLDENNKVIGIAVTGADNFTNADQTTVHGIVPIQALAFMNVKAAKDAKETS